LIILYLYFSSRTLQIRVVCSTCGQHYSFQHEVISAPSADNVHRGIFLSPSASPSSRTTCADPLSSLLFVDASLGEPTNEVLLDEPMSDPQI